MSATPNATDARTTTDLPKTLRGVLEELKNVNPDAPRWDVGDEYAVMNTAHWLLEQIGATRTEAARQREAELYRESDGEPAKADMECLAELHHSPVNRVGGVERGVQSGNTYNDSAQLTKDILYVTWEEGGRHGETKQFAALSIHRFGDPRGRYTKPFIVELTPESRIAPGSVEFWCADCGRDDRFDPYAGWLNEGIPESSYHGDENHVECPECGNEMSLKPF